MTDTTNDYATIKQENLVLKIKLKQLGANYEDAMKKLHVFLKQDNERVITSNIFAVDIQPNNVVEQKIENVNNQYKHLQNAYDQDKQQIMHMQLDHNMLKKNHLKEINDLKENQKIQVSHCEQLRGNINDWKTKYTKLEQKIKKDSAKVDELKQHIFVQEERFFYLKQQIATEKKIHKQFAMTKQSAQIMEQRNNLRSLKLTPQNLKGHKKQSSFQTISQINLQNNDDSLIIDIAEQDPYQLKQTSKGANPLQNQNKKPLGEKSKSLKSLNNNLLSSNIMPPINWETGRSSLLASQQNSGNQRNSQLPAIYDNRNKSMDLGIQKNNSGGFGNQYKWDESKNNFA